MLNPISPQLKIYALIVAITVAFGAGWKVHGWQIGASQNSSTKAALKEGIKLGDQSADIIGKRDTKEQQTRVVYRTIHEEINHVQDADHIIFTADSLRLWNRAIAGADNDRREPAQEAAPDDAVERQASLSEVLDNAADNFEDCKLNANDHNALIDKIQSLKGKMCVCQN